MKDKLLFPLEYSNQGISGRRAGPGKRNAAAAHAARALGRAVVGRGGTMRTGGLRTQKRTLKYRSPVSDKIAIIARLADSSMAW